MNKKGQMNLGVIIVVAIAIIVGVIFFQTIAQQVGSVTNTVAVENQSLVTAASNGAGIYLTNWRAIGGVTVWNATGGKIVTASNYTVTNNVIHPTTGDLAVNISISMAADDHNGVWTIDGTGQPLTYVADSGARAVTGLIVLMFALALIAAALYPIYSSKLLEMFGK